MLKHTKTAVLALALTLGLAPSVAILACSVHAPHAQAPDAIDAALDTTDPHAPYPPDRRFVNQGTDPRIPGELGERLALIQRLNSFKSATPPIVTVEELAGGVLHEVQTWPNGARHDAWAFPTPTGRWNTYRIGHRWDRYWGDERTKGYNPNPEIIGGAVYDVVIKLNSTSSFITLE